MTEAMANANTICHVHHIVNCCVASVTQLHRPSLLSENGGKEPYPPAPAVLSIAMSADRI
jgi:hypothetical protein